MENIFDQINAEALEQGLNPQTVRARDWFRQRVKEITAIDTVELMRSAPLIQKTRPLIGEMYLFLYDPKTKKKLKYYDTFPLIIMVDFITKKGRGFYGINLHYLPPTLRAKFLTQLLKHKSDDRYDEKTRFEITYDFLKNTNSMRYFKPCFKRYLSRKVQGRFSKIPASEWGIATFLPTANFEKASESTVYADSRKKVR